MLPRSRLALAALVEWCRAAVRRKPSAAQRSVASRRPLSCQVDEWQARFAHERPLEVGLEEEVLLLDPETLAPSDSIDVALDRLGDERFHCELRSAQLEATTRPCATVAEASRELSIARSVATDRLTGVVRLAAAGLHPCSSASVQTATHARYQRIASEYPWSLREGHPCGLHVHVGMERADQALAVFNAARSYLPELAALAANSPFLGGRDTHLASARLKLNETFPRAGVPPALRDWEDLVDFVSWGIDGGLFPDPSYLWWHLRLNKRHGTLEFRVADAQTRVAEAGAVAAVCHSLVAALVSRHEAGERLPVHDTQRIAENQWRAIRDGLDATFIDPDDGTPEGARSKIGRLLESLEPFAESLGARGELIAAWTLLEENGAERQRRVAARFGFHALLRRLVHETEVGSPPAEQLGMRSAAIRT